MSANAATANAGPLPQPKAGAEPSMEEILASIRRIIADDNLGKKPDEPTPAAAAAPVPEADPDEDILDLADIATVPAEPEMAELDDIIINDPDPEPMEFEMPAPVMVLPANQAAPVSPLAPLPPVQSVAALEERILSQETGSLVGQAFQSLSRHTPMPAQGRSLEDVMVEMLRPMLRDWMDSHLPSIVERIVKAEVERVARG